MPMKSKIGYGSKDDLSKALQEGTIDNGDIVFTEDTEEVAFIKPDNTPMWPKQRTSEEISVNGVTGLGIPNGSKIPAGKSLDEVVKMLVQKAIPATYTKPSVTLANNGGSAAAAVEAGTTVTPKLRATFNKNDAGAITKMEILKDNQVVNEGTASPHDYAGEGFVIGDVTVAYTARATYGEGAIKNDNLGQPSPNGHIAAGSVTSSKYQITGQRNLFYGTGVGSLPQITSDVVRGLANKKLNPTQGFVFNIPIAVGQQYVIFAYKANLRDVNQILYVETNDTGMASSFTKNLVDVADARGGENGMTQYKVYTFEMATPAAAPMTFKVTI